MNAANFSRTSLGRALLHAACLCRHPAAARFFLTGLSRNLRQCCGTSPIGVELHEKLPVNNHGVIHQESDLNGKKTEAVE